MVNLVHISEPPRWGMEMEGKVILTWGQWWEEGAEISQEEIQRQYLKYPGAFYIAQGISWEKTSGSCLELQGKNSRSEQ